MTGISILLIAALTNAGVLRNQSTSRTVATETVRVVVQVGLGPETLAAAGVTLQEAAALLVRVDENPNARSTFLSAVEQLGSARTVLEAAISAARENPADEPLEQAVATATSAVAAAHVARTAAAAAVIGVAVDELPAGAVERLAGCQQAKHRRVAPAMWMATLTPAEWDELEVAIIAERRALRMDTSVPTECASVLAGCRAQPAVVQAQQNIDGTLASIQALFEDHE